MDLDHVDLAQKLSLFSEHWSPKAVARLNDYEIKVVKLKGEFVWHARDGSMRVTFMGWSFLGGGVPVASPASVELDEERATRRPSCARTRSA